MNPEATVDPVIKRIQALLRKARHSATRTSTELQNEAETAMKMAVALMRKHGFEQTEVEVGDDRAISIDLGSVREEAGFSRSRLERWDKTCAQIATTVAGCGWYYRSDGWSNREEIVFYGLQDDIAVARTLLFWLRRKLNGAAGAFLDERARVLGMRPARWSLEARSYRDGWTGALLKAVRDQMESAACSQNGQTSRARSSKGAIVILTEDLLRAKQTAIAEYAGQLRLRSPRRSTIYRDPSAYVQGRSDGSRVQLSRNQL